MRERLTSSALLVLFALGFSANVCSAADLLSDRNDVNEALKRARQGLRKDLFTQNRDYIGLYSYACFKIGLTLDDPVLANNINRVALNCQSGQYVPAPVADHAVYVAGIEAMLLSDAGGAQFERELGVIRDFLVSRQNPNGSWAYTVSPRTSDMSVTQYAVLGLWAAERAGATVEKVTWARAAKFLLQAQLNGGYAYRAEQTSSRGTELSMTAAGLACLVICRKHLADGFSPPRINSQTRSNDSTIRYGLLRPVTLEPEDPKDGNEESPKTANIDPNLRVSVRDLDNAIKASIKWMDQKFRVLGDKPAHRAYWYYTLERAGALSGQEVFANQDWYDKCADDLLPKQKVTGHWGLGSYDVPTDTAMVALFLARPTRKLTGYKVTPKVGGGLLAGGRGLPTDLSDFGKPAADERQLSPLEQLLDDLAKADETALPKLQEKLVQQIQVTDREALVGQQDALIELVEHPRADVRRTALWAIGRTGDLRLARYPIQALDDRDVLVLAEARNALAWIARRPESFGHPENPLEGAPQKATLEEKVAIVDRWRQRMLRDWGAWYIDSSPYAERFDEFDLELRSRLARMPRMD